jgi:P-type Cu+ transporter
MELARSTATMPTDAVVCAEPRSGLPPPPSLNPTTPVVERPMGRLTCRMLLEADGGRGLVDVRVRAGACFVGMMLVLEILRLTPVVARFSPVLLVSVQFSLAATTLVLGAFWFLRREEVATKTGGAAGRLAKVDVLLIEKAGLLTDDKPRLVEVIAQTNSDEDTVLTLAASLICASAHPLGGAVLAAAQLKGLPLHPVSGIRELSNESIEGVVGNRKVAVGSAAFFRNLGVSFGALEPIVRGYPDSGAQCLLVSIKGKAAGIIALAEGFKPGVVRALDTLRSQGIHLVMVTPESSASTQVIARYLGLAESNAPSSREEGSALIDRTHSRDHTVLVLRDAAHVRRDALHRGSYVQTVEEIFADDVGDFVRARALSHEALERSRVSSYLAVIFGVIGISIAAGELYNVRGSLMATVIAAAVMSLGSVCWAASRRLKLKGR